MKYLFNIAQVLVSMVLASMFVSCSSAPKYALMPTLESKLDDTDHEIKPGMAITKRGAVLDIKIEEVQAQKKRLEVEIAEKDQALKYLAERNLELETNMKILRTSAGLPPDVPKGTNRGFNADGNMIGYKRPKTLSEEIIAVKGKRTGREPASAGGSVVTESAIEPEADEVSDDATSLEE